MMFAWHSFLVYDHSVVTPSAVSARRERIPRRRTFASLSSHLRGRLVSPRLAPVSVRLPVALSLCRAHRDSIRRLLRSERERRGGFGVSALPRVGTGSVQCVVARLRHMLSPSANTVWQLNYLGNKGRARRRGV